jgi:hypothetical protein
MRLGRYVALQLTEVVLSRILIRSIGFDATAAGMSWVAT